MTVALSPGSLSSAVSRAVTELPEWQGVADLVTQEQVDVVFREEVG